MNTWPISLFFTCSSCPLDQHSCWSYCHLCMTNQNIITGSLSHTSLIAHIPWGFQCQFSLTLSPTILFFPGTLFRKYKMGYVARLTRHIGTNYSRSPLILHPWYGTSAELSDILDYHTVIKFFNLLSENVHLSVIFTSSQKDLAVSITICPVTGFPLQHNAVNYLHSTLSNSGCCIACHLKRSCTLSLYATNVHN